MRLARRRSAVSSPTAPRTWPSRARLMFLARPSDQRGETRSASPRATANGWPGSRRSPSVSRRIARPSFSETMTCARATGVADHTPVTRIAKPPPVDDTHVRGDHLVHEAVGPSIAGLQAAATIGVGVNSLMFAGILPVLLGALADEHRLSASGIGLTAM